ncbi:MAG: hypothetical protein AUH15_01475 [Acidobacteriales bacterium 13_2_20CM_55_8]|nr:MAG: hypothetical protein AUH15_01475 [Acidobacteriales bacterium 13_2_20CM_55_8]
MQPSPVVPAITVGSNAAHRVIDSRYFLGNACQRGRGRGPLYLRLLLKHAPLDENFVNSVFAVVSPALSTSSNGP